MGTNTMVYPLIYVRTVLGADLGKEKKYNGMFDCLKKTIQSNGVLSLYNGIGPSTIGIVVYLVHNLVFKIFSSHSTPTKRISPPLVLHPNFLLHTLQRRLQIEASKPKEQQMYNGMVDCFGKILKNEGPGGFFKGALANVLRGTGAALVLVIYDEIINAVS